MGDHRRGRQPERTAASVALEARDEIDAHIAMQIADLVEQGWSREAAAD